MRAAPSVGSPRAATAGRQPALKSAIREADAVYIG